MPDLYVTVSEWNDAKEYLNDKPSGTKLSRKDSHGIEHSFIKINDTVYCLANTKKTSGSNSPQDHVIEQGRMSKVKYAHDEHGNMYIIKINGMDQYNLSKVEADILKDLSLSSGSAVRYDRRKMYTDVKYLGKNLWVHLASEGKNLSDKQRLDIAAKFAYQVYQLHHGMLSLSKTGYAHHDIKPDNVVIDEKGDVRLIDFGMASRSPFKKSAVMTGASSFTAYDPGETLTAAELDTVALKRSLFLPLEIYCHMGHMKHDNPEFDQYDHVLPQNLLTKYHLVEFIDTHSALNDIPDYSTQVMDPLVICAALINAKEQLGFQPDELKNNKLLCHVIVGVSFSSFSDELKVIIAKPELYPLAAALHSDNSLERFAELKKDESFCKVLAEAQDESTAFVLLKLKDFDRLNLSPLILKSLLAVQFLERFFKDNRPELALQCLEQYNENLQKELVFAMQNDLSQRYEAIISQPDLVAALASLPQDLDRGILVNLMKDNQISSQHLITYCTNPDKREAVEILFKNNTSHSSLVHFQREQKTRQILEGTVYETIITKFRELSLDKLYIDEMINSEKMCEALNILFKLQTVTNLTLYDLNECKEYVDMILLLKQKNLSSAIPLLLKAPREIELMEQLKYTIEMGYGKYINKDTLTSETHSVQDFLLNLADTNCDALKSMLPKFKGDYQFMCSL
ncbi:Protein kinase domain protein, partial [Legionella worsleiensis]